MSADVNSEKVIEEILRLQQARTDAIQARDGPALQELFDDDLVHIHASGRIDSKDSFIAPLLTGKSGYKRVAYSNVKVRVYGDCAIVTGDVIIENFTQELDLRYTNVWVKSGSSWRSVSWHSAKRTA